MTVVGEWNQWASFSTQRASQHVSRLRRSNATTRMSRSKRPIKATTYLYLKELKKYLPGYLQNRSLMCDRLKVFVLLHCEYDSTQTQLGKKPAVLASQPFILKSIYEIPHKMNVLEDQLTHANDEQVVQAGFGKLSKIVQIKLQLAVLD